MLNWVLARVGADMVVPSGVYDQTGAVQFSSVQKRAGKEPTVKQFNPRAKSGIAQWEMETEDLLIYHSLFEVAAKGPPTKQECQAVAPNSSEQEIQHMLEQLREDYIAVNTEVYFLIMPTLDLSGDFCNTDMATIKRRFHSGENRDGHGLYQWVRKKK